MLLAGCLATEHPIAPPDAGGTGQGPYCEVSAGVFIPRCTACHRPGGTSHDLTFEGAATSLVGKSSASLPGRLLVVPSDPEGSLLFRKISGAQAADERDRMPPGGAALSAAEIARVRTWIEAGAPTSCEAGAPDAGSGRYHPEGFAEPEVHGTEMKLQQQDCRSCHGQELAGALGPSCDSCHPAGWRTRCVFCHGGSEDQSGAPPRDLSGAIALDQLRFAAHGAHVRGTIHAPFACGQCHREPDHVLSPGHAFDDTPGAAEVDFGGGLSPRGVYGGGGSCSALYCHGSGQGDDGSYDHQRPSPGCGGCHPGPADSARWRAMSGEHEKHLDEDLACSECHRLTVGPSNEILDRTRHVNRTPELGLPIGMSESQGRCSGTCHGELHQQESWR